MLVVENSLLYIYASSHNSNHADYVNHGDLIVSLSQLDLSESSKHNHQKRIYRICIIHEVKGKITIIHSAVENQKGNKLFNLLG